MASPLVLTYDVKKNRQCRAHRSCAVEPRFVILVALNAAYNFGDALCGICGQRLKSLPLDAATNPHPQAAKRPDAVVWAKRGSIGATEFVVAHRRCLGGTGYVILFEWSTWEGPYRGQPQCDICGEPFYRGGRTAEH